MSPQYAGVLHARWPCPIPPGRQGPRGLGGPRDPPRPCARVPAPASVPAPAPVPANASRRTRPGTRRAAAEARGVSMRMQARGRTLGVEAMDVQRIEQYGNIKNACPNSAQRFIGHDIMQLLLVCGKLFVCGKLPCSSLSLRIFITRIYNHHFSLCFFFYLFLH